MAAKFENEDGQAASLNQVLRPLEDLPLCAFDIDFADGDGADGVAKEVIERDGIYLVFVLRCRIRCSGVTDPGYSGCDAGEDVGASEGDIAGLGCSGDGVNGDVVEVIDGEGVAESLDVAWIWLDAGDLTACGGIDAGGSKEGVEAGVSADVKEVIAGMKVGFQKLEHVPVKPL